MTVTDTFGLIRLIKSGKFSHDEIVEFVNSSSKHPEAIVAAIQTGKFGTNEIVEFVNAGSEDYRVIVAAIQSGKIEKKKIAGLVKASGKNREVTTIALEAVKKFEGMPVDEIVEFVNISGNSRVFTTAILTGKLGVTAVAEIMKASGGNCEVCLAVLKGFEGFKGMSGGEIIGLMEASNGNPAVIVAGIETGKIKAHDVVKFVEASGGDEKVVAAACKFFKIE